MTPAIARSPAPSAHQSQGGRGRPARGRHGRISRRGVLGAVTRAGGRVPGSATGPVWDLHGSLVRSEPQGHAGSRRGREARLPASPGPDLTEHPRRPSHRPRPRRAQLPDRTSPVPVDAAAEPPARTGTSAGVLRLSQHSLLRAGPAGLLTAGIATPPPLRQAASPTRILIGPRLAPMCSLTADHEAVAS